MSTAAPPLPHTQNPWPGLISYTEEQAHLFFGREAETGELFRLIQRDTLTVLFGRSGLGKTSLLRAGVFPRLRREGFFPVVLRLDYSPQASAPVEQVKALTEAAARESGIDIESAQPGPAAETLWEYFHRVQFWGPRNDRLIPVLVFDQFEEIFTHDSNRQANSELLAQLADLAENRIPEAVRQSAEASPQRQVLEAGAPDYKIVLSLREDFVWRLDTLRPILPAVMRNRFALGPLDAAHGLLIVRNAGKQWVTDEVARDIIAAVISSRRGEGPDRAADEVEPAYLNVMCNELFERMAAAGQTQITRQLVASEKGEILESLYDGSFRGLSDSVRRFVEEHLVTPAGFRATLPVDEAHRENVSDADLQTLVDRHLLRFEDRLGTRHVELAHDLLTELVLKRREQRERALLQHKLRVARIRTALVAAAALLLTGLAAFYWLAYMHQTTSYYANLNRKYGSYEVIGRLSRDEVSHRSQSLRVYRKGFRGEITAVEAVNGYDHLIMDSQLDASILFPTNGQNGQFCRLEFTYDEKGQIIHEVALDEQHRMVFALNYAPTEAEPLHNVRRASVVAADGATVASSFDIQYSSDGYPSEIRYLTPVWPQTNFGATIIELKYSKTGPADVLFLNAYRNAIAGSGAFAGYLYIRDARGDPTEVISHDLNGRPVPLPDGEPPIARIQIDKWGNPTELSYFDAAGNAATWQAAGFQKQVSKLDDHGLAMERRFFSTDGMAVAERNTGCYVAVAEYDQNGIQTVKGCLNAQGAAMNQLDTGYEKTTVQYDLSGRMTGMRYYNRDGQPAADQLTRSQQAAKQIFSTVFPPKPEPANYLGCYGWLWGYDRYFTLTLSVCLDGNGNAYSLDQLAELADDLHDYAFDFDRAFELQQQLVNQDPDPLARLDLEESALSANHFDVCEAQAAALKDVDLRPLDSVLRQADLLACQFASGNKAAARTTAASLTGLLGLVKLPQPPPVPAAVPIVPSTKTASPQSTSPQQPLPPSTLPNQDLGPTWNSIGTRYYLQNSPYFQAQSDVWDKLFASLQIGDTQGAIDALNQLQTSLR